MSASAWSPEPASPNPAGPSDLDAFTTSRNKYAILGVAWDAPPEAIKRAYRRMAFLYHPDRRAVEEKQQAEEIFRRISRAYDTLSDPALRARYDELVRRGREDVEVDDASSPQDLPLSQILANIYEYEHVFESDAKTLPNDLYAFVLQNLIKEVNEEVIAVVPIKGAPTNSSHEGNFRAGAMVFTTVRVMIPFKTSWEVRSGGTRTIFTRSYMPIFAFPNLTKVTIVSAGKMRPRTKVEFRNAERFTEVRSKQVNLAKLLLLCNLWGVPVEGVELPDAGREWRRVLLWHPLYVALAALILYGALLSKGDETWQAGMLAWSAAMAVGFVRGWRASRGKTIRDLIWERLNHAEPEPPVGAEVVAQPGA